MPILFEKYTNNFIFKFCKFHSNLYDELETSNHPILSFFYIHEFIQFRTLNFWFLPVAWLLNWRVLPLPLSELLISWMLPECFSLRVLISITTLLLSFAKHLCWTLSKSVSSERITFAKLRQIMSHIRDYWIFLCDEIAQEYSIKTTPSIEYINGGMILG